MKWIALAFVSLFFYQVQAQSVCLQLLENSLEIKNDTLYFKFKIQNNGTESLVFYNLNSPENGDSFLTDSKLNKGIPGLLVDVMNTNNELPSKIRARTAPYTAPLILEDSIDRPLKIDSMDCSLTDKYHIIKPNETKEYDIALDIWPIYWQKGIHKIQLRYYSNNYYNKSFRKAQKTDVNLKNSILFKGILRTNMITYDVLLDHSKDLDW